MGKEMEGDNRQRRARAKDARDEDRAPGEDGVTTGASNQRRKIGGSADHADRLAGPGWGKQQPDRAASQRSAPTVADIARESDLSLQEDVVPALQRPVDRHDVVQELPGDAQGGHRYRVKAR